MNQHFLQKPGIQDAWRRCLLATLRVGGVIAATLLVAVSLMMFPAGVPYLIAAWLGAYTVLLLLRYRSWPVMAGCVLVVLVKRIDWLPGLACLAAAVGLAILLELRWRRKIDQPSFRRMRIAMLAVVWLGWCGFVWDWRRSYHANHVVAAPDTRPIVCIGDSLTSYPPHGGYPKHLARLVRAPVINLGQPGVTTAEAMKQLPKLKAARPQALIIELGGHDFLKDPSWLKADGRNAAKRNLEQLIATSRSLGAEVVIVEVPRGFVVDPFAGLERELARQFDLELVSDTAIRNFVLWSRSCPPGAWTDGPYLSDDGLHPNTRGDEYLASVVFAALTRLFGPEIASERP